MKRVDVPVVPEGVVLKICQFRPWDDEMRAFVRSGTPGWI